MKRRPRSAGFEVGALVALAILPHLPFLRIPLISDDYTLIYLGREYGSPQGWSALAADPLYRCRATSMVSFYLVDLWFGPARIPQGVLDFLLHALNTLLVFWLCRKCRLGRSVALLSAGFFAVYEGHQEAVVWSSARPELFVFLFAALSLLAWLYWLESGCRGARWAIAAVACFILALYSKESGVVVVALHLLIWLWRRVPSRAVIWVLTAEFTLAVAYTAMIFFATAHNQHLGDGTFSLNAPFWWTLPHSMLRMFWIWGLLSFWLLWRWRSGGRMAGAALVWIALTLAPYSFLLYMDRVPSRHIYFASAGLALIVGLALAAAYERLPRRALAHTLAALVLIHNVGYLWWKKIPQYERRAEATERFLRFAAATNLPIRVQCSPYSPVTFQHAVAVRFGRSPDSVLPPSADPPFAVADYCDRDAP